MKVGKILSFHAHAVTCIRKGKLGKDKELGRVLQLGRIKGDFLFVGEATSLKMSDKQSLTPMLTEHGRLFGNDALKSVSADKGYWSRENRKALTAHGVVPTCAGSTLRLYSPATTAWPSTS